MQALPIQTKRGADTFTENLLAMRRLDDFAPVSHPLRPVRKLVNQARVDGTPIQACAGRESFTRKDSAGDDMGNFKNTKPNNDTHDIQNVHHRCRCMATPRGQYGQ